MNQRTFTVGESQPMRNSPSNFLWPSLTNDAVESVMVLHVRIKLVFLASFFYNKPLELYLGATDIC